MPELVVISENMKDTRIPLEEGAEVTIGRRSECTLAVDDASLSRHHCRIVFDGQSVTVTDLKSRNHTYVNDQPVETRTVTHGDTIRVGGTVLVVDWPEMAAPEPDDEALTKTAAGDELADPQAWVGREVGGYVLKRYVRSLIAGLHEYEGEHKMMARQAVVSLLLEPYASQTKLGERFMRLAQTVNDLQHPNVVVIYDVGRAPGCYYLATEVVSGKSVKKLVAERGGPLPPVLALDIAIQIADVLKALGQREIVHRDIAPANILLTDEFKVKISNLWITKRLGSADVTSAGRSLGTFEFMSPEQIQDSSRVDHRSDLYGLGATLYFMLFGHVPFGVEGTVEERLRDILQTPLSDVAEFRKSLLPKPLKEVLTRLLEKDPSQRYAKAAEAKVELQRCREAYQKG